jgi:hypothetical protein
MSKPLAVNRKVCPHCRAENFGDARQCWLCFAPFSDGEEIVLAEVVEKQRRSPLTEGFFLLLTFACLVLMAIVGLGLAQEDRGFLIPYMILITPPILATVSRTISSASQGKPVSAMDVFLTFLISASVTVLIVMVLFVAAVVALFALCLYMLSQAR